MYRYIIFDLDGTLIDTSEGTIECFRKALDYLGIEMTDEKIRTYIGPPFTRTLVNEFKVEEERARRAMDIGHAFLADEGYKSCFVFEGMRDTLDRLKEEGIRMGVATSQPIRTAEKEVAHVGIGDYFECFEANDEYQTRGTKSDFVRMCLEDMDVTDRSRVLMIGDKPADINGGKDNGLDTAGVLYGYGTPEEIDGAAPDHIINEPEELLDLVLRD